MDFTRRVSPKELEKIIMRPIENAQRNALDQCLKARHLAFLEFFHDNSHGNFNTRLEVQEMIKNAQALLRETSRLVDAASLGTDEGEKSFIVPDAAAVQFCRQTLDVLVSVMVVLQAQIPWAAFLDQEKT